MVHFAIRQSAEEDHPQRWFHHLGAFQWQRESQRRVGIWTRRFRALRIHPLHRFLGNSEVEFAGAQFGVLHSRAESILSNLLSFSSGFFYPNCSSMVLAAFEHNNICRQQLTVCVVPETALVTDDRVVSNRE